MSRQNSITPLTRPTPTRLRGGRIGSLEIALVFVAVLGLLLGLIQIIAGLGNEGYQWALIMFTVEFWIWVAAGVVASWRRPDNGTGALLLVGAISVMLGGIGNVGTPVFEAITAVFGTAVLAVTIHLLLAFPSGRLRGALSYAIVAVGYLVAVGLDFVQLLLFLWYGPTGPLQDVASIQRWLGLAVMTATAIVLVRRLVRTDRRHRRVLLPLFLYGSAAVILIPLLANILRPMGADNVTVFVIQVILTTGLPIAFLLGVFFGGFARMSPLEALSAWLAVRGTTRPAVAQALAATLGDDTLRVEYWDFDSGTYLDERGIAIDSDAKAESDPDRGRLEVRVESNLIGAIDYDARMVVDSRVVRRAGEVLAIAIDRERLTAQLLASNEELVRSRKRLVEAADRERSRIARDLHDGLQMQLVLLAIEAQTIADSATASPSTSASAETLRRGIDEAASDLRRLVHDVLPAALLERGLVAATEDLVDRLEVPASLHAELDEETITKATAHTAYFILAEALANTVKHARATMVRVTLSESDDHVHIQIEDDGIGGARVGAGVGLRGLLDRVDALRGTTRITSVPEEGTRIEVSLPRG